MRVFVTGGTGLVGTKLAQALVERGDTPIVLTRSAKRAAERFGEKVQVVEGEPQKYEGWPGAVSGCQAVVNLAGEPLIGKRWSPRQKEVVRASRVESTQNVVRAIRAANSPPATLVSASAVGIYGNVPEGELTEDSPLGNDFLASVCKDWEAAAKSALDSATSASEAMVSEGGPPTVTPVVRAAAVRVVLVRIGVVLDAQEGALKKMLLPFKLGLGGPVGRGKQWVSWVHIDDIVRIILFALDTPSLSGPVNATAPQPVRNKQFSQALAKALRRPCLLPIPPFALKLRFGEVAQVIVEGQKVLPARLLASGFGHRFSNCEAAMVDLFGRKQ